MAGLKAGFSFDLAAESEAEAQAQAEEEGGNGSAAPFVATWMVLAGLTVPSAILFRSIGKLASLIIPLFTAGKPNRPTD